MGLYSCREGGVEMSEVDRRADNKSEEGYRNGEKHRGRWSGLGSECEKGEEEIYTRHIISPHLTGGRREIDLAA